MADKHRLFKLLALVSGPAVDVVQHYFEVKIMQQYRDFEDYLNDPQNKHKLFHEYYPKIPCCGCILISIAAPYKRGCLGNQQFAKLYDENGTVTAGHEKTMKGQISQHCICKVSAQKSVKVTDIDITLISAIIQHCCPLHITTNISRWMIDIKEVRNNISHLGKRKLDKQQLEQIWKKLKTATLKCAGDIGHTSLKMFQMVIYQMEDYYEDIILQTTNELSEVRSVLNGVIPKEESMLSEKQRLFCAQISTQSKDWKTVKTVVDKDEDFMPPKNKKQRHEDESTTDENASDEVPTEIKLMTDKRSVELYLKLLESGSEKKRDIRLVIVGKKGAGKTSLIKRLFGEDITDVTSTNGIEIHKIKCKAKSDDGIWNKLDENYEKNETDARILKEYEAKLQYKGTIEETVESNIAFKDNTPESQVEPQVTTESHLEPPVTTEPQVEPSATSQQQNQSLEQATRDIETMLKSNIDFHDKEEYATLLLWDFAGEEEFYHTHQTFLSPDAIYLVVSKLNEAGDKKAQDLFQLWMDSIHCYSRLEEDGHKSDVNEKTSDDLDPPIVIVGTWKDALISDVQEIDDACSESIFKYTENMSENELRHIRHEYFISNTEDDPSAFQQVRENILNLARKMKTWNKDYPLKFIQLETRLQEKKKELPIISFQEIQNIASDTPNPLNDEELRLFLEFHHEIRALVYFKDLPSYIILDTQWLSDAFKCIVTAKKFRAISIKNRKKWDVFYSRGILYNEVLEDIFKKENNFSKHKDHILNVMEKFDIIIHPNSLDGDAADETPCYYVPCIIKAEPEYDIYEMFNVTENTCTKSTWLCYQFRFLPPHLMNHLIASLCRKYKIAEYVTKEQEKQIALFRGSAVFELQKTTKLTKLHVMKCPNLIQIQVWQFGKERERGLFKCIDECVTEEIVKIISTRFKMSNVNFEKKWECGHTKPEFLTGSNDFFGEEQITEYYCETCTCTHIFIGEWQDLQKLSQSCEMKPVSNSNIESISQVQTTSSKVCVRVEVSKRDISNIHEESSAAAISTGFSKEEINCTKMGMIALNILADALYDLLKPDKPNLRPRSDCDITNLYSEHRKLNKHIPSNLWGGSWQTIRYTDIAIGDDIERIRLTRNELQHSRIFKLEDKRFNELCNILGDLLKRFDHYNKPTRLYTDELNDILAKTISAEEVKSIENDILGMMIEVEMEY